MLSIGKWNARTAKDDCHLRIIIRVTERFHYDIIGLAETYRLDTEEFNVKEIKYIRQGQLDSIYSKLDGIILRKLATESLQGYNPISECIIVARYKPFKILDNSAGIRNNIRGTSARK